MFTNHIEKNRAKILAAASVASLAMVSSAFAQSNVTGGQVVISSAGSTALKNWIVKTPSFTYVQPNTTINIGGNNYPSNASYWSSGLSYQIAPSTNAATGAGNTQAAAAVQFVYHESGSVEGILEMANDQLYTNDDFAGNSTIPVTSIGYVTANVDRNPEGGNAVWLNDNQIGSSGSTTSPNTFNASTGASVGSTGLDLGNFYGSGVGQTGTSGVTTTWTPGSASNPLPTFVQGTGVMAGALVNSNGGQNAVQFALSDAIPQQVFQNNYSSPTTANTSFNSSPANYGYGAGNPALVSGSLGTAGSRNAYQAPGVLNVSAAAQNPDAPAGTDFGTGPWNSATQGGLGNLNSQFTAVTATAFVANPGTGLSQLNRTDADWLELTGRLSNGAGFNMTTRDVNSGTRDVAGLDTGVDPSWASGKNDNGNGNLPNGVSTTSLFDQTSIGPAMRFSNKTAGGAQLRPTVQNNRMAVGTLSINDANTHDTNSNANPVYVLSYSDNAATGATDTASDYPNAVSPNYNTISNGTYVIYQNEQVVTLKSMSSVAAYNGSNVVTEANGAEDLIGTIQGDDNNGDVVTLLNNTANSVNSTNFQTKVANPADGLLSTGYIIPSLMQVEKAYNGEGLVQGAPGTIDTGNITSTANPNYNSTLWGEYIASGGYAQSQLPVLTSNEPTTGSGSYYGAAGNSYSKSFYNSGDGTTTGIAITNNNYLFGNFNQNGIRDYNAVKSALNADEALISADIAAGALVPGSEFTIAGDSNGAVASNATYNGLGYNTNDISYTDALGVTHNNLSKGDLIVMGDFNGDGHFDGADLVAMAENSAISTNTTTDRLSSSATMYQTGVSDKNAAMDYMNTHVPEPGTVGANATTDYIRSSGRAILEGASIPFGATPVTNLVTGAQVVDPVSNELEFSYDPTGVNTFNKSDVNDDGVVDFNDAVVVDNENGQDYTNIADQTAATMPAPVSGTAEPLNLVMAKQSDGSTVINSSDVAVVNTQLTGTGNTNWYGYNLQKNGPATIDWARTGGTVTVYSGAKFEVSGGLVQIGGTQDPFTDNHPIASGSTGGNHVAVAIDNGGKMQITQNFGTIAVSGLNINSSANSSLDLGTSTMMIDYGSAADPINSVVAWIKSGYNGGAWNGAGINSSAAAAADALAPGQYAIGYADGDSPNSVGLSSGQIEIKYTLAGDANLDGKVNGDDFTLMATNFNDMVTNGWDEGDFNYSNTVNGDDFVLLANNFNDYYGAPGVQGADLTALENFAAANGISLSGPASVPEPASGGVLIAAGLGFLAKRRRSRNA